MRAFTISSRDVARCPQTSLSPEHYREDGSCRCVAAPAWIYDDGGRAAAGFRGETNDCVARAIAIAARVSYADVYRSLNELAKLERPRGRARRSSARLGISKRTTRRYFEQMGWTWTPTMGIGTGCQVHLRVEELPGGHLVVQLSGHVCAVIDGVARDICDPTRDGTRCVYGLWSPP